MPKVEEAPPVARRPVPARFIASRSVLRLDALMTHVIRMCGFGIIVAVFGIFLFIFSQVIPLFRGASVKDDTDVRVAAPPQVAVLGVDENGQLPFFYDGASEIRFASMGRPGEPRTEKLPLPAGTQVTAVSYDPAARRVVFGTGDGHVGYFDVSYAGGDAGAVPTPSVKMSELFPIGQPGAPVEAVAYGDSGGAKLFAAVQNQNGVRHSLAFPLLQKDSLLGEGKITRGDETDLTPQMSGKPVHILVPVAADSVLVSDDSGTIHYFYEDNGQLRKRQEFKPFADTASPAIASMDYVFGDVSLVLTNAAGACRVFSLFVPPVGTTRLFNETHRFEDLPGGATFFCASRRNKSFLIGTPGFASLRHATTAAVRWEQKLPFEARAATVDGKFKHVLLLGTDGTMHRYDIHDPHPEAGWKAFFGKVWYEGASAPKYEWQSTGGSDEFEPKLSLVPLIFGTLKGTLWAMFFAVPIALLAAIYAGHFLQPGTKRIVKPAMEIMASLPSVVLGFLAALWLAPILETKVVSFFLVCLGVPAAAMAAGMVWARLPPRSRARLKQGNEWLVFVPLMLVTGVLLWKIGPWVESLVCVVKDPATGEKVADFRQWWPRVTGCTFDQRNSLVVGFMMGFAVIPVIFTIADDSISNVPGSIIAASHALGASRWQTVRRIVLPVASAGIFSALMIGLGRAVGETMIVVMATGNTPIMDWNLFSGMRTLAANIAVELPEASVHSTHYRTLFLGAVVLFLMTFVLNTGAELLRQRLREKFKIV